MIRLMILLTFFTTHSIAEVNWEDECLAQGHKYGKHSFISVQCQKQIIQNTHLKQYSKDYMIYAWKNILLLQSHKSKKSFIIAGDKTLFFDIKAIYHAPESSKTYVVDGNKILVFPFPRSGNIVPTELYMHSAFKNSELLAQSYQQKEILTYKDHILSLWSPQFDNRVKKQVKHWPQLVSSLKLDPNIHPSKIYMQGSYILVVDHSNKQIFLYQQDGKQMSFIKLFENLPDNFIHTDFSISMPAGSKRIILSTFEQKLELSY